MTLLVFSSKGLLCADIVFTENFCILLKISFHQQCPDLATSSAYMLEVYLDSIWVLMYGKVQLFPLQHTVASSCTKTSVEETTKQKRAKRHSGCHF